MAFTPPDKKAVFVKMGYEPHELVWPFHNSRARFRIISCPRQSSKSYSAAKELVPELLIPGSKWWLVGPKYGAIKEFDYLQEDMAFEIGRAKLYLSKPPIWRNNPLGGDMRMRFPWGSEVICKSCEQPRTLQGEALDGVLMSEAAQITDPRIWQRYLQPTLAVKQGKAIFPTTPDMDAVWLRDLYEKALVNPGGDWEAFSWPVYCNPLYPMDEYNKKLAELGEDSPVFREQYKGEWVFHTGRVYSEFQRDTHVIEPFPIPPEWRRVRAIDWGHRDPFAVLWIAVGPDKELYAYREYKQAGEATIVHAKNVKEFEAGEKIHMSVADPSGKQLIADMAGYGISCSGANTDRKAGRERVCEYLHLIKGFKPQTGIRLPECERKGAYPKLFVFSNCRETIREFTFLRWAHPKEHEGVKEKTVGPDHLMDVLRYIAMTRPSPFKPEETAEKWTAAWFHRQEQRKRENAMLLGGHDA